MASSIPRERRKDYAAICTEVSSSGTGYTTGGYALTGKTSAYLSTNGAIMTAYLLSVSNATFSVQYGVIYDSATDKIEGVQDWYTTYVVTNGTITITFDNSNGVFNIQ